MRLHHLTLTLVGLVFAIGLLGAHAPVRAAASTQAPAAANLPAGPKAAPLLNAQNLTGSVWNVKTPEMPIAVQITLNGGGQAVAKVPPLFSAIAIKQIGTDTLTGTWSVQGDKLIAKVEFQGKGYEVACDIIGDKIYYQDREIPRIQ